jgi:hypothetical protein
MPVAIKGTGGGSVTLTASTAASDTTVTLPNVTGTAVVSTAVSSSSTNTVTNKIAINIGGTVYYILASTSGT